MYSSVWKAVSDSGVARGAPGTLHSEKCVSARASSCARGDIPIIQHTVCSVQVMCCAHSVGLHGMAEAICVRADDRYKGSVRRKWEGVSREGVPS
jgi:hypothetical protein